MTRRKTRSKKLNVKHPKRNNIRDNQEVKLTMVEANDGLRKLGKDGRVVYNYVKDSDKIKTFEKKIKKGIKHKMDKVRSKFK